MTGHRRGPVGLGYLPKGGRKAGEASNGAWKAEREAAEVSPSVAVESSVTERPVSARQRAGRLLGTSFYARLGAASGVLALLVEAVWR